MKRTILSVLVLATALAFAALSPAEARGKGAGKAHKVVTTEHIGMKHGGRASGFHVWHKDHRSGSRAARSGDKTDRRATRDRRRRGGGNDGVVRVRSGIAAGGNRFSGLPPGLGKRASLPPGLAKRITLPPGLAKGHSDPPGLAKRKRTTSQSKSRPADTRKRTRRGQSI